MSVRPTILHVEDSEEDVFLLQYAFRTTGISNPVQVVDDGDEAIDYLAGRGKFADRQAFPLPCLVLLDLKMPRKMGLEVLEWIRQQPQPEIKTLIVIVLSASANAGDVSRAYELNANAFLVKPSSSAVLADMCEALKHFWLVHNTSAVSSVESA
jgi:CheY-like chemotaxis protein